MCKSFQWIMGLVICLSVSEAGIAGGLTGTNLERSASATNNKRDLWKMIDC
jgi:hypothetical protein